MTRTLTDGRTFRIVKSYLVPDATVHALRLVGWRATVVQNGPWVVGDAVPD